MHIIMLLMFKNIFMPYLGSPAPSQGYLCRRTYRDNCLAETWSYSKVCANPSKHDAFSKMRSSQVIEVIYAYYSTSKADDNRSGEGIRLNFYRYGALHYMHSTIQTLELVQDGPSQWKWHFLLFVRMANMQYHPHHTDPVDVPASILLATLPKFVV